MKESIHTRLLGRRVKIVGDFNDHGPQSRYHQRKGQVGEIVNVYLKDGEPSFDVLFEDGRIEDRMYTFAFEVQPQ